MLNFEEEVKKVQAGYVVMSLEEYNKLNDKILDYSIRAIKAEADAKRRVLDIQQSTEQRLHNLLSVRKKTYGDRSIDIIFNTRAIHDLAVEIMRETYTDAELAEYEIKPADDLLLCDEMIAYIKDTKE